VLEVIMSEFQQRFMTFGETLSVTIMNGEKCGYVKDIGFAKSRCSLNIKPERDSLHNPSFRSEYGPGC